MSHNGAISRAVPRRLIQFLVSAAVLSAVLWLARWALVRWIDGPKQMPSSHPWPPLPATEEEAGRPEGPALGTSRSATGPLQTAAAEPVQAPERIVAPEAAPTPARIVAPEAAPTPDRILAPEAAPPPEQAAVPEPTPIAQATTTPQPAIREPTLGDQPTAGLDPALVVPLRSGEAEPAWLSPEEPGTCPPTHPVKAKLSTRLYREPGTAAYDRAQPDRCYVSPDAAEADGFRRAKR